MAIGFRRTVLFIGTSALAMLFSLSQTTLAESQELEPRSYSASPIDSNFAVGLFTSSVGTVPLDPSLPLSNVRPAINTISLSFTHTFPLFARTASWAVFVPYLGGHVTATAYGQSQAFSRDGFPDFRARIALELLRRAQTPAQFAHRNPSTTLGVSLTVSAPTGTYDRTQLINIGANRWTVKPEIGVEQPMGRWFADASAGVWIFGENTGYHGSQILQQASLGIFQIHSGYNFRPGQWLAVDVNYFSGGATSTNGGRALNGLSNSRYGFTFSQPVGRALSVKIAWSHWLNGQYGQRFSTAAVALQYLWFNRR